MWYVRDTIDNVQQACCCFSVTWVCDFCRGMDDTTVLGVRKMSLSWSWVILVHMLSAVQASALLFKGMSFYV